jgi:hypothetical protein
LRRKKSVQGRKGKKRRKGEEEQRTLRNLDGNVVALLGHEVDGSGNVLTDNGSGSDVDEVDAENLGNEGERTGRAKVALDDLEGGLLTGDGLADDLHVVRTRDLERLGDLLSNDLESLHVVAVEGEGREDDGSVTRVNTGLLDVLGDGVDEELALVGDGVDVNLLSTVDELGEDGGVLGGDLGGGGERVLEGRLVPDDVHGGSGEDVGGTDEDGVGHLLGEVLSGLDVGGLNPGGLVDTVSVKDSRELVAVLSRVDHRGVGTENVDAGLLETKGDVLGKLTTDGNDDTLRALELVDVHDTLPSELLEVHAVGLVVVGRDGFGVVVDHDRLLAHLADLANAGNGAPIELDRRTDAVDTGTENHRTLVVELDVVLRSEVGGVEVVGVGRVLGGEGVDTLDEGSDTERLAVSANGVLVDLGVASVTDEEVGDLTVGETELLGLAHEVLRDLSDRLEAAKGAVDLDDVVELVEEPLVDLGKVVDLVDGVVEVEHGVGDREETLVGGDGEGLVDVLGLEVRLETGPAGVDLTNGLLEGLLEGTTDTHDLADGLHRRTDVAVDVLELGQVPLGDLGNEVVESGLEAGGGGLGDSVGELRKSVAESDLCGGVGERVTGGLRGESGRTGETSVHLGEMGRKGQFRWGGEEDSQGR